MAEVSSRVGVGPMAAVAGAIAECAVRAKTDSSTCLSVMKSGG
jgi:ApbE superfamily uncharacterized protein (UPF0280 family)